MRALILEDNISLANVLKEFLLKKGWQAQICSSWKEADLMIDQGLFDLYVIDILLPDTQGFEVLKALSEKNQICFAKIALISGFFDHSAVMKKIPPVLKKQCVFFKKPIQEKSFLQFLKDFQPHRIYKKPSFFEGFFCPGLPPKALNFYLPEKQTFDSKYLISALFLSHLKGFTGDLKIQTDKGQKDLVKFYKGAIFSLISNSKKSFFGNLLVEHGLSSQENIQFFLEDTKNSQKRLGEKLVKSQLLNPQMLNFILKQQIKIRLSEIMKSSSFHLKIINKKYETETIKTEIDFNELDFIEWLADSLQTELRVEDLEKFYLGIKNKKIQKSSKINRILINHKKFLEDYNFLFQQIKADQTIESFINSSPHKNHSLKLLYFGLLTKSIFLRGEKKELLNLQKTMGLTLDSILEKDSEDLFAILNLSWKASIEEVEQNYKQLVQTIHPDLLPSKAPEPLRKKCEAAFKKINHSYKYLRDTTKRAKYLEQQTEKDFINVIQLYEEGLTYIKNKKYKEAHKSLLKIADHKQAPSNTILYILWAKLKSEDKEISQNRKKGIEVQQSLNSCPIDLRISPLFWYVKGLFFVQAKKYDKAKELFKKALQIEKNFTEAKTELIRIKHLRAKKKPKFFQGLLKKSS